MNTKPIIIVGDIHGNFIKFFEPLKQANIIKDYKITVNSNNISEINYSFHEVYQATSRVIYLGDFIHRGRDCGQILILESLVDICTRYPNDVNFVLGNHEIAECNYYLNNSYTDLYQLSTLADHNICKEHPNYDLIIKKFMEFLEHHNNLLMLEFPNFIISHTYHFKTIPGNLKSCLNSSKKFSKCTSMVRPKTPRCRLPSYLNDHPKYLEIKNKYRKVSLDNYNDYELELNEFINNEYENYVDKTTINIDDVPTLFDEFIHHKLNKDYYYEIFKFDLFGYRTEESLTTGIQISYNKTQIIGHDKVPKINVDKDKNIIYVDCENNSWLIYDENENKNEKLSDDERFKNFYIYIFN